MWGAMMWEFSESGKVVGNSSSSSRSIGLWGAMMWEFSESGKVVGNSG